jgi:hypothetical protein
MAWMGGRTPGPTRQVPVVLLLALVVGCGGGGGGGGGEGGASSPTRTPTADRSVDRPSDRPTAERTDDRPGPDETDDATPEEPTPEVPAPTRDRPEGSEDASSDRVPESQQPSQTSKTDEADPTVTADDADGEGETVPPWVWWLVGALLLGVAVAVPLIVRGRRHAAWRAELVEAEGEIAWFARDLLRGLRHARSREEVSGGWTVGQPRVVAAEDKLTVLESSAPDQVGGYRARELLNASRQARARMDTLTGPGSQETWMLDLDAIIDDLEHVLVGRRRNPSSELPE